MIDKELLLVMRNHLISEFDLTRELSDEEVERKIEEEILKQGHHHYISLEDRCLYKKALYNDFRGFDILQDYIDDDEITEIMVNGQHNIFFEKFGQLYKSDDSFISIDKLNDLVQQIASFSNRRVNETSPIADARLKDGSRVNIVLPPVALDGPIITIRKFHNHHISMENLIEFGSISKQASTFLETLVVAGYNIFISGGTGSGKTTFLNILSDAIPSDSRVITIEDSAELQIKNISNLVRLESRQVNLEGTGEISIRDLIKSALRMRPDRIIVGEVRGSEALDMLQAMNTGHDGSMSTGHANSTHDMLTRLETMVLMGTELPVNAIRGQIFAGIDIIVHLGRLRDKSRRVLEICELSEFDGNNISLNTIFKFKETGYKDSKVIGALSFTGTKLLHTTKLDLAGLEEPIYE